MYRFLFKWFHQTIQYDLCAVIVFFCFRVNRILNFRTAPSSRKIIILRKSYFFFFTRYWIFIQHTIQKHRYRAATIFSTDIHTIQMKKNEELRNQSSSWEKYPLNNLTLIRIIKHSITTISMTILLFKVTEKNSNGYVISYNLYWCRRKEKSLKTSILPPDASSVT